MSDGRSMYLRLKHFGSVRYSAHVRENMQEILKRRDGQTWNARAGLLDKTERPIENTKKWKEGIRSWLFLNSRYGRPRLEVYPCMNNPFSFFERSRKAVHITSRNVFERQCRYHKRFRMRRQKEWEWTLRADGHVTFCCFRQQ